MKPDLETLLAKWQKILRLQDWDVKISYRRHFDMLAGKAGTVCWNCKKKTADIEILDPTDIDPESKRPEDIELTVVHELVHLHFAPIDDTEGLREIIMEQGVENIARALVDRDRQGASPVPAPASKPRK